MPRCIIIGCGNDWRITKQLGNNVSYHIFPKNTQRRYAWINKIKQPFKFKADSSYVCSKHFVPDDFVCNRLKEQILKIKIRGLLKKTAVPSINLFNTSEETKNAREYIRCVPIQKLIYKIDSDNKCEKLLKNKESLCTTLNTVKGSTALNLNTEHLESPYINRLTQEMNQNIQVSPVKGELMLHTLPQIADNVSNTHLDKTITDEEEEIIIATEDEANHIDLSSYVEEVKGNTTEVIIPTGSKETKNTHKYIRCVPIEKLIHKIDSDNKREKLLKNNESLCTPLNTDKGSLSQDKGCQVMIPCKGCENKSLKINKLLKERARLLKLLNQNGAWRDPDEINTL